MAEQAIVFGVRPNPESDEIGAVLNRQGPVMQADADGPESTGLFEMQRRVAGILAK
jgi:hypothetical protein